MAVIAIAVATGDDLARGLAGMAGAVAEPFRVNRSMMKCIAPHPGLLRIYRRRFTRSSARNHPYQTDLLRIYRPRPTRSSAQNHRQAPDAA